MFGFFKSKNRKAVEKWEKEHGRIVELATNIIAEWNKGNLDKTKDLLKELNSFAVDHLMHEDLELFNAKRDTSRTDEKTTQMINEFVNSFRDTKKALMAFLRKYTMDDAVLDETFIEEFEGLVAVLLQRIEFEEKNLYVKMKES